MIKIAFFDIDGTLLKLGNKQPTENTITALKRLQENGILRYSYLYGYWQKLSGYSSF